MDKIDFSKLNIPRMGIPDDIVRQLASVQPMPDNCIKDILDALDGKTLVITTKAENGS